jgi:hypothetical protein
MAALENGHACCQRKNASGAGPINLTGKLTGITLLLRPMVDGLLIPKKFSAVCVLNQEGT